MGIDQDVSVGAHPPNCFGHGIPRLRAHPPRCDKELLELRAGTGRHMDVVDQVLPVAGYFGCHTQRGVDHALELQGVQWVERRK